jgi:AcrR family transcriptional regulator
MAQGPDPADMNGNVQTAKRPAHRPSRRVHILGSAVTVFAQRGYTDTNIDDVAVEAGVAPTAIYYHFGGKAELFHEVLRHAMDGFSVAVLTARPDRGPADVDALRSMLCAGWQHWRTNPNAALLVARYSAGTSAQAGDLRREWEERHRTHVVDIVEGTTRDTRSPRKARERQAVDALAISLLLDVVLVTHEAILDNGALGRLPKAAVQAAAEDVCVRLMTESHSHRQFAMRTAHDFAQ